MNIRLERVENGFVLSVSAENRRLVFSDSESMRDALAQALNQIVEEMGERGSRYDSDRIHISLAPGDKSGIDICPICGRKGENDE